MFLLCESSPSVAPYFQKLPTPDADITKPQHMFFPEPNNAYFFHRDGIPERSLITWTHDTLVSPDKCFVDIGAHIGTYTWICGRKAKHTYAFECDPRTFCSLAANVALHHLTEKVSVLPFALGNQKEARTLFRRSNDGGGNGIKQLNDTDELLRKDTVYCETLDSFRLENIGLIKIDVEGNEMEVLQGANETIEREQPKILFESWTPTSQSSEKIRDLRATLFAYLDDIKYQVLPINQYPDMFLAVPRQ